MCASAAERGTFKAGDLVINPRGSHHKELYSENGALAVVCFVRLVP